MYKVLNSMVHNYKAPNSKKVSEVLKIAVPCILEQFMMVMVGTVSIAIIGHLGRDELVATSMTNQLVAWLQCVYIGLSAGGTVVIARMWGNGEKEGVKSGFIQNLIITIIISLSVLSLLMIFQKPILNVFFDKATESVLNMAFIYFTYCMIGMPATAIANVINASVRGVGDNKTPLYSALVLNACNIILSIIFIYGFPILNIPPMGVTGAGIAILVSRYISALFTGIFVYIKKSPILPTNRAIKFEKKVIFKMFKIGLPTAFEQLIFQGGFVVLQTLLIGFGTVFQGGYQIGANLNGLIHAPAMGLHIAITVLISQALGKRDFDKAEEIVKVGRYIVITGFILLGIFLVLLAPYISRTLTSDIDVIESGTIFARMFGFLVIPLSYFQIMSGVLRGSGDVKYVAITSIIGLWIMRIFGVWILAKLTNNGYTAVIAGVSADFVFRAVMYHLRVKKGTWKYIRI